VEYKPTAGRIASSVTASVIRPLATEQMLRGRARDNSEGGVAVVALPGGLADRLDHAERDLAVAQHDTQTAQEATAALPLSCLCNLACSACRLACAPNIASAKGSSIGCPDNDAEFGWTNIAATGTNPPVVQQALSSVLAAANRSAPANPASRPAPAPSRATAQPVDPRVLAAARRAWVRR
jgi:hypothetical protein